MNFFRFIIALTTPFLIFSQDTGIKQYAPNYSNFSEVYDFDLKFAPGDGVPYMSYWYKSDNKQNLENAIIVIYRRPPFVDKSKNKIIAAYLLKAGFITLIDHFEIKHGKSSITYGNINFNLSTHWEQGRRIY